MHLASRGYLFLVSASISAHTHIHTRARTKLVSVVAHTRMYIQEQPEELTVAKLVNIPVDNIP
jgi:hypothetical protein